jgi:CRISPR-associated endonuclease/helicase Cas3
VDKLGGMALVLRRRDLLDLFDTTPDLAGADIDVSRFIRDTDDHDVRVFWRDWEGAEPNPDQPGPSADELCPVPIHKIKELRDVGLWLWDHQEKEWLRPQTIFPGLVLMLNKKAGGYNPEYGWTGDKKDVPEVIAAVERLHSSPEAIGDDPTARRSWQTLADHINAVVREVRTLIEGLPVANAVFAENLLIAARWHDGGKSHFVFQNALAGERGDGQIWAKAPFPSAKYERTGFRHELASALAMIQSGLPDLAAYLAAAHHGKVRLSIRSMPNESTPPEPDRRFARGIWDGDAIGPADLGGGEQLHQMQLDLSLMEMGEGPLGDSWLARMLALRDAREVGPFRLAYLEVLLRIADWRASAMAEVEHE